MLLLPQVRERCCHPGARRTPPERLHHLRSNLLMTFFLPNVLCNFYIFSLLFSDKILSALFKVPVHVKLKLTKNYYIKLQIKFWMTWAAVFVKGLQHRKMHPCLQWLCIQIHWIWIRIQNFDSDPKDQSWTASWYNKHSVFRRRHRRAGECQPRSRSPTTSYSCAASSPTSVFTPRLSLMPLWRMCLVLMKCKNGGGGGLISVFFIVFQ